MFGITKTLRDFFDGVSIRYEQELLLRECKRESSRLRKEIDILENQRRILLEENQTLNKDIQIQKSNLNKTINLLEADLHFQERLNNNLLKENKNLEKALEQSSKNDMPRHPKSGRWMKKNEYALLKYLKEPL